MRSGGIVFGRLRFAGDRGQEDGEAGSIIATPPFDGTVVGLSHLAREIEAEPSPVGLLGHKGFEQAVSYFRGRARPRIGDLQPDSIVVIPKPFKDNACFRAVGPFRRFQGVQHQIHQHLHEGIAVPQNTDCFRRRDHLNVYFRVATSRLDELDHVGHDGPESYCRRLGWFMAPERYESLQIGFHELQLAERD